MRLVNDARAALRRRLLQATWNGASRETPPCLWSKGISQLCDFRGPDWYWLDDTESCQPESFFRQHYAGAHGLLWIRLSTRSRLGERCDLDQFVRAALPSIRAPFALVTTDGDASVPGDIAPDTLGALLGCPWLVSWHTQNCNDRVHPKLAPFPIGLDLHTPRAWSSPQRLATQLRTIASRRQPLDRLPLRVFCDLAVRPNAPRWQALAALQGFAHVDFLTSQVSQVRIWRRYADYPFVVSAAGNGLDCHRTWEILHLGSIVITKTSPLDPLYDGLPVVSVDDWSEVGDQRNLANWLAQYRGLADQAAVWERLEPARWVAPIREALASADAGMRAVASE